MTEKYKYRTVSIPTGITNEIEHLIEQLRYWPSARKHLRESRETEKSPIRGAGMPQAQKPKEKDVN